MKLSEKLDKHAIEWWRSGRNPVMFTASALFVIGIVLAAAGKFDAAWVAVRVGLVIYGLGIGAFCTWLLVASVLEYKGR